MCYYAFNMVSYPKTQRFTLVLSPELLTWAEGKAEKKRISVSAFIRNLMWIKKDEEGGKT